MSTQKDDRWREMLVRPWDMSQERGEMAGKSSLVKISRRPMIFCKRAHMAGYDMTNIIRKSRRSLPRFLPRHGKLRVR